jgi:hypothetical protein
MACRERRGDSLTAMSLRNLVDPNAPAHRLESWLSPPVANGADVTVREAELSTASGMSNETLFLEACGLNRREQFVAWVAPAGQGIFMNYDLTREHAIMDALSTHTTSHYPVRHPRLPRQPQPTRRPVGD